MAMAMYSNLPGGKIGACCLLLTTKVVHTYRDKPLWVVRTRRYDINKGTREDAQVARDVWSRYIVALTCKISMRRSFGSDPRPHFSLLVPEKRLGQSACRGECNRLPVTFFFFMAGITFLMQQIVVCHRVMMCKHANTLVGKGNINLIYE